MVRESQVSAGLLRHRVEIQKYTETRDASTGEVAETWVPYRTIWADVSPLTGSERLESQQVKGDTTFRVSTRYVNNIAMKDRLKYICDGIDRYLYINAIIDIDGRKRKLEFMCREQENASL